MRAYSETSDRAARSDPSTGLSPSDPLHPRAPAPDEVSARRCQPGDRGDCAIQVAPEDDADRGTGACPPATAFPSEAYLHYLAFANIRCLIDSHMAERSLMIDVHTRYLLARLSETAAGCAERLRGQLPAVPEHGP